MVVTFGVIMVITFIFRALFGKVITALALGGAASAAVGGVIWFGYGIYTGNSDPTVFAVATGITWLIVGLPLLRNDE